MRLHYCNVPYVEPRNLDGLSPYRAGLIRFSEKKWVNGTNLHFSMEDTSIPQQQQLVREGFDAWTKLGIGISFQEVANWQDAEIRISFQQDGTAWSYLGRDAIDVADGGEPTMNFGWPIANDPRGVDVAIHEIGHALGFPHEHQNPFSNLVWDDEEVYRYFAGPPNHWPQNVTYHNIIRKLLISEVAGSDWDKDSIMHYEFPGGLIKEPPEYTNGLVPAGGLSNQDIVEVQGFYPFDDGGVIVLMPFLPQQLSIVPGSTITFKLQIPNSGLYDIRTFGNSDTVMVLFERHQWTDRGGNNHDEWKYVDGDDDSGHNYNASISTQLYDYREYELRLRLYSQWAGGETVVMLW